MGASTAQTIECGRCAAAFSIEQIRAIVFCPFCGQRQKLRRHTELRAYQADVAHRVAAADEQRVVAASLEAWSASRASDPKRNLAVAYGLMVGTPFALALVLYTVDAAGLLPKQSGPGVAFMVAGGSYLGVVGYLIWYFTGRKRRAARKTELAPVRVACPTCGAPGALTPGEGVDTCAYCSAALIPSRTAIRQGVDAARAAVREASIARRRAQREVRAKATNLGGWNNFMAISIVGSMLLMLGASTVGFTYQMIAGTEPYHPAIFVLWALTIAVFGGVFVYLSRRRDRKRALVAALDHAVRQLGGTLLPEARDRVGWLNAMWSADYDPLYLTQTYVAGSAAVQVGGYHALIDVDLHRSQPAPRLQLLLAAWVPGKSDDDGSAKRTRHAGLEALGFCAYRTAGGLEARAQKPLLDRCLADPSAVHVAVPALNQLAALARDRDCDPVGR